jgi:hypothetical protein
VNCKGLGKRIFKIAGGYLVNPKSCALAAQVLENNLVLQKDFGYL